MSLLSMCDDKEDTYDKYKWRLGRYGGEEVIINVVPVSDPDTYIDIDRNFVIRVGSDGHVFAIGYLLYNGKNFPDDMRPLTSQEKDEAKSIGCCITD